MIAQMEKAGYVDAYRRFAPAGERSFLTSEVPIRIDYIFSSQSLVDGFQNCQIWPAAGRASDHLPVFADLTL
ncbi:MAG: hypothetical protein IPK16_21005 [Anaerolineales bacterium]|nr:hypothetical protein [Anaerolineales bacterium]